MRASEKKVILYSVQDSRTLGNRDSAGTESVIIKGSQRVRGSSESSLARCVYTINRVYPNEQQHR